MTERKRNRKKVSTIKLQKFFTATSQEKLINKVFNYTADNTYQYS